MLISYKINKEKCKYSRPELCATPKSDNDNGTATATAINGAVVAVKAVTVPLLHNGLTAVNVVLTAVVHSPLITMSNSHR
ncbi:MAG: hypothetical protein Aurels2KO_57300 [Aureliella sp.]